MLTRKQYVDSLRRIYVAHDFYEDASEGDKERIYNACEPLFDFIESAYKGDTVDGSLSDSCLDRSFGTLLLLFGDVFLKQQFGEDCSNFDKFVEKYIS